MKTFVVTGASTGIGRATSLHLARGGARVLAGVRKPSDGESLVAQAEGTVEPLLLDVADPASVRAAADELAARLDGAGLDGLVNNAGIAVGGVQEYLELSEWRRQFDVNVFGLIDTTHALLPLLMKAKGRVVNVSSIGGRVSSPFMAPYHASKFAVEALTDSLRMELRPLGLWAACVEPGAIKTEIWRKGSDDIERIKKELPTAALERYRSGLENVERFATRSANNGTEAIAVAKAIEHALTASRPRTRYLVGTDAHLAAFFRWLLPDRALEWVMARA